MDYPIRLLRHAEKPEIKYCNIVLSSLFDMCANCTQIVLQHSNTHTNCNAKAKKPKTCNVIKANIYIASLFRAHSGHRLTFGYCSHPQNSNSKKSTQRCSTEWFIAMRSGDEIKQMFKNMS
jgi:hypothetical protein